MTIKKFKDWKINELSSQSASKPIENDGGEPAYSYGNIKDILGSKYNFVTTDAKLKEFEETVISKETVDPNHKNDAFFAKRFVEFNRNKWRLTPPFQDDLIQNNDFYVRAFYDEQDTKNDIGKEIKHMKYRMKEPLNVDESIVNEDGGVASVGGANVSGMGVVVTSQPSSIPGDASGATTGSGDIGSGWDKSKSNNRNVISRPNGSRRKNKMKAKAKEMAKNFANQFKGDEYKQGGTKGANVMNFTAFSSK